MKSVIEANSMLNTLNCKFKPFSSSCYCKVITYNVHYLLFTFECFYVYFDDDNDLILLRDE